MSRTPWTANPTPEGFMAELQARIDEIAQSAVVVDRNTADRLRERIDRILDSFALEYVVASRRDAAASAYYRENVEESKTGPFAVGDRVRGVAIAVDFAGTVVHVDQTEVHVCRDDGKTGSGRGGAWRCAPQHLELVKG